MASFTNHGSSVGSQIIAGDFPRVERKLTIAGGSGILPAGSVIALDGSGKGVLVDSGSVTPSEQSPHAVLSHDVDATLADAQAIVYFTGEFDEAALVFGGTDTLADHAEALRALKI